MTESYGTITITDTTDLEWFYGTDVLNGTGDSVNHQIVLTSNLINGAAVGSMYLDTQTSLVYKCIEISDNSQTWQYIGNMASGAFEAIQEELENNYVQQDDALISTVSCYYRSTTHSTPSINSSVTINGNESNNENNNINICAYFLPKPKKNCYFYTCEEYTWGNGNKTYSSVREMSNQSAVAQWCSNADSTYIDGGSLYANSITASQIAAGTITANEINTSNLFAQDITATNLKLTDSTSAYMTKVDSDGVNFFRNASGEYRKINTISANAITVYEEGFSFIHKWTYTNEDYTENIFSISTSSEGDSLAFDPSRGCDFYSTANFHSTAYFDYIPRFNYGNSTHLISTYYFSGDVVSCDGVRASGDLTTTKTQVEFFIPLLKSPISTRTWNISNINLN